MKLHIGIHHTRNSYDKQDKFWKHKCISYMEWYKKYHMKNIQKHEHRIPDDYDKRDMKSHLMHCYTYLYMQLYIGRVKNLQ